MKRYPVLKENYLLLVYLSFWATSTTSMSSRDRVILNFAFRLRKNELISMNQANNEPLDFRAILLMIGEVFSEAHKLLQEDMEFYPSFDPNKRYEEKNYYVNRANNLGQTLFYSQLHPCFADLFYRSLLDIIINYEKKTGKKFNKGIPYANLGIAQISQGKFDQGIANLLTAEWEDREVANPKEFILDSPLWKQFEDRVFDYLKSYNEKHTFDFIIDNSFLEDFFRAIDREDRIFLQGTILALKDNLDQFSVCANSYTFGRLYAFLKDLCLLIESLLRKKQLNEGMKPSEAKKLYNLLFRVLKNQEVNWPQPNPPPTATDLKEFVDQLDTILSSTVNEEIRRINCVYLVRNFTGHHFRVDEAVKSFNSKSFFTDMYLPTLENIIVALLYFKHINAI